MTEISHVIVFVACTYVTINSTVFERFCVDSRKRIETPVDVDANRSMYQCGQGSNRERQQERQKSSRHQQNNNYAPESRFLYISMPSQHHYDEKLLNFTSCGGLELRQRFSIFSVFLTQIYKQSFRIQLQKYSPTFD